MDKRDWKLLAKLDVNGRIPITELAKACRVSKETALYRFNKLEREGVLTKHYPFINVYALGYLTIRVYFELQEMTEEKEKEFVSFLDTKTKASFIFRMDNVHKYGILIWAPNIYDIEKKLFALKKGSGELLTSYTLSVFCSYKQYSRNYLFPFDTKRVTVDFRPTKSEEVDKEDLQILKALSADARMSTLEMSRRTGIPQTTISSRIRKLLQRKILRSGFFVYIASRKIVFFDFQIIDEHLSFLGKSFFYCFKKFLLADILEKFFGYAGNFYHRRINFRRRRKISGRRVSYYFRPAVSFDANGQQTFFRGRQNEILRRVGARPASGKGEARKISLCLPLSSHNPFRHFFLHHQNH